MMSKKILMVFVSMIFLALALAPTVQAFTSEVAYSSGQSNGMKTVTEGDVVGIQVTSIGIGEKLKSQVLEIEGGPNSIDKQLFSDNSQGRKEGFVREYGRTYKLDTSNYQPGTYTVKFTSKGQQSSAKTSSLKLVIKKKQPPQDNNAPNLNINYPNQGQTYNSQVTELRYTPTDFEGNLDKCWYSTDSGQTNSSKVNCNGGIQNTFSGLSSNQGQNTWTVWASDTSGNVAKDSVTFKFDNSSGGSGDKKAPIVNILSPTSNLPYAKVNKAEFNVDDPENNLDICWYSLDGGPNVILNCQEIPVLNDFNINPGVGTHTLKVYAQDDAGNVGSDTVNFTITGTGGGDNTAPTITPINPKDGEKLNNKKVKFNVSTNEQATVKYNLQGVTNGNITMNNPSGNLHEYPMKNNLTYGKTYQITYYATDSAGNTGKKTITFEIKKKSQKPGTGSGNNKSGSSGSGSGGDGFIPGQGGYYNHEKDEYLDQFDEPQSTRIIESPSGDDKSFFGGVNLSKWILPILAALIGLTMIALAVVLGMRQSEEKAKKSPQNYQNVQNQRTANTEQPRSQYDQGPYWY